MSSVVVIGSQWGTKAKERSLTIWPSRLMRWCRYSGGSNAGHTVVVNDVSYKLRLLPSASCIGDKTCILATGL